MFSRSLVRVVAPVSAYKVVVREPGEDAARSFPEKVMEYMHGIMWLSDAFRRLFSKALI